MIIPTVFAQEYSDNSSTFKITVEEGFDIAGVGKTILINVVGANGTTNIKIITIYGEIIETLSFVASDSGEISLPWIIPKDIPYGTYTITATDSLSNFIQTSFQYELDGKILTFSLENSSYSNNESITFIGNQTGNNKVFIIIRDMEGDYKGMLSDLTQIQGEFKVTSKPVTEIFDTVGIYKATAFTDEQKEEDGITIKLQYDGVKVTLDNIPLTITTADNDLSSPGCLDSEIGCYTPNILTVEIGDTITMTNTDEAGIHTFTSGIVNGFAASADGTFDSGVLPFGDSFEYTADTAGEYPYYCMLHVWMQGKIIVNEIEVPISHVVINEVDINPPGDDSAFISEWVELYNPTNHDIDIGGWEITSTTVLKKTLTLSNNTTIQPKEFLTFSYQTTWFTDSNESIELRDENGIVIDKTPLLSDLDNDFTSWQRIFDGYDTDSSSDWKFVISTAGSSNGKQQSEFITVKTDKLSYGLDEVAIISGSVSHKVFVYQPFFQSEYIIVNISGPNFYKTITLYPDSNLNYETTLSLQQVLGINEGNYDVSVSYGGATANTSFTVEIEPQQLTLKQTQLNTINHQIDKFEIKLNHIQTTIDSQQVRLDKAILDNYPQRIEKLTTNIESMTALQNIFESLITLAQNQIKFYS